jgi:ABC-type transporter Mla subunit MlaD
VSQSLSRGQAVVLGLVVVLALMAGGYGVARIADKQGLWSETVEVTAGFPEVHDVTPGTPVRIRGVDAGQVVAVEYPDHDGPDAEVTVRMKLDAKYATRLYGDATAQIQGSGVFGSKVIAVQPGSPGAGPLAAGRLKGLKPFSIDEAVAELRDTAATVKGLAREAKETAGEVKRLAADVKETSGEARGLIKDVRESDGTFAKLVKDDELYRDIKEMVGDAKSVVKRADKAVGTVDDQMKDLKGFVSDGRDTLRSVKQGTDAVQRMPIIRGYVENANALLVRPNFRRERMVYNAGDLFQAGTAIRRDDAAEHFGAIANWLRGVDNDKAEVVVVAFSDPNDPDQTPGSAQEMTRKQAEAVVEYLKGQGVHKLGWTTRRKMTPLGMGVNPSPVVEKEPLPPSNVQVLLFIPQ